MLLPYRYSRDAGAGGDPLTMRSVCKAVIAGIALSLALAAQNPAPVSDTLDDARDEALIRMGLEHSPSVDDIYRSAAVQGQVEKQAEAMTAASQRRIARAEKALEAARALLPGGKDPQNTLAPYFAAIDERVQTGYQVIERAGILKEVVESARIQSQKHGKGGAMVRFDGNRKFTDADFEIVSKAFERRFHRPLPVSADGQTSLHSALGFDHRGRVDVALSPDQTEGLWLCNYLRSLGIPYFAFRRAVAGSATSAHIHMGPGSVRLHAARTIRHSTSD